jgi:fatty-acyl-CoA synthase
MQSIASNEAQEARTVAEAGRARRGSSPYEGEPWSIGGYVSRNARRFPLATSFHQDGRQIAYAEFNDRVNRLANAMTSLGVMQGHRVALLARNNIECAEVFIATARIGAIAVPVNFRLVVNEIVYILQDVEPALIIAERNLAGIAAAAIGQVLSIKAAVVFGAREHDNPPWPAAHEYEDIISRARPEEPDCDVAPQDPAYILYTSGTTGRPKGAVLSHAGCIVNSLNVTARLGAAQPLAVRAGGGAMFHTAGLNSVLQQLIIGGTSVLLNAGSFDPAAVVEVLARHRVDTAFMVPTQWRLICGLDDLAGRLPALRRVVWGASSNPRELLGAMFAAFPGVEIFAQFGQTEMSGTTCTLDARYAESKLGSVGRPLAHVQARIVDEQMRDVAPGGVGEIVYQGPGVQLGYWRNAAATESSMAGGWFHSGDLCRADEDGFIYLVDRLKDVIISGGENIYCLEVEAALSSHYKIAELAVAGAPHSRWGETPVAYVVPVDPTDPPTLAELLEHLASRLASYKRPTSLHLVETLPRNASGKVLRQQLKQVSSLSADVVPAVDRTSLV